MKICNKCKQILQEEDFNFKNKIKNKRSTICRECQKIQKKNSYHKNKEFTRDAFKRRRVAHRLNVINFATELKQEGCIVCGEKEICCLDFHHTDPTTKVDNIANTLHVGNKDKILEEAKKCIILCANCHRKYHAGIIILE